MAEPPDRRPPDPDDETRILPREDAWPEDEETVVQHRQPAAPRRPPPRRPAPAPPRRPPQPPQPPPPGRALWPWLLLLLGVVVLGIVAAYLLTRESEPDLRAVPAVVRLPEQAARDRLEADGFDVAAERGPSDAPVGIVFAQTPGAGRNLPAGATVTIHVSEGPAATTVPNVIGLPEQQALERLEAAELQAAREEVFSEEPPGSVVAQEPAAGEEVERGSTVRIGVSAGTGRVEVPDVRGEHVDDARAALAEVDLQASVVQVPSNEPEGTVVAQSPSGGAEATRGDAVRLNVSRGP
jgi:eukaryotic-like serine/threonine-protein kinase